MASSHLIIIILVFLFIWLVYFVSCFYVTLFYIILFIHHLYALSIKVTSSERQGTPWVGCQSIAELTQRRTTIHTFTTVGNLEKPVNHICISLDCGRKRERYKKAQADTEKTLKVHTKQLLFWTPEPYCCEVTMLTTISPYHLYCIKCTIHGIMFGSNKSFPIP